MDKREILIADDESYIRLLVKTTLGRDLHCSRSK